MRKSFIFLPVLAAIAILLGGCFFPFDFEQFQSEIERLEDELSRYTEHSEYASYPDTEASSESSELSETDISDSYGESSSVTEASVPDEDTDTPTLATLVEVRDYINGKKAEDVFDISFIYTGDTDELDGATIARISSACCITYRIKNGNEYFITVTEYPGDRIADAYHSGDVSKLNSEEKRTLDVAEEMVSSARSRAESDIELEILLHDMLLSRITYYDGTTDVPDAMNPPRHLTAVGALLDNSANCQGYADAFYLLASMAGFDVGRMNVFNSDGWHIVNTIYLGEKWYIVDVTFDDSVEYPDGVQPSYRLLNAGKDSCAEYEWGPEMEYYPIADKSDENYFYFLPADGSEYGYKKAFDDFDDMAQYMADEWYYNGRAELHTMFKDGIYDWDALSKALKNADSHGEAINYDIWCFNNGRDTFFIVRFS